MEKYERKTWNFIGDKEFDEYKDMYKVIDFLNKNLKRKNLIFGLKKRNKKDVISIYASK